MKYYIRFYEDKLKSFAISLVKLFIDSGIDVELVDHSNVTLDSFGLLSDDKPFTIDKYLSIKLNIPYFQVSRVFGPNGFVCFHQINGKFFHHGDEIITMDEFQNKYNYILDTDKVSGTNLRIASKFTKVDNTKCLLHILDEQELIDVEDLFFKRSLLFDSKYDILLNVSYLYNLDFFSLRTSLPLEFYSKIKNMVNEYSRL